MPITSATQAIFGLPKAGRRTFQSVCLGTPGIVEYWPLSETSGTTLRDLMDAANTITISGTYTLAQAGPTADGTTKSILFTNGGAGSNGIGHKPNLDADRSVAIWFKTASASIQSLFSYGANSSQSLFAVDMSVSVAGRISLERYNGGFSPALPAANDGRWHLLVLNYSAAAVQGSIDGATFIAGSGVNLGTGTTSFGIGKDWVQSAFAWNGNIGPIAFFGRVLTQVEVMTLWATR